MRLWLTRPEPDAARMAARLAEAGHAVLRAPLLRLAFPDPPPPLPLDRVQALIATSRNGLRALARMDETTRARARTLPLFAVGESTAALAREMGFAEPHVGSGTAKALAPLIARHCDPARGPLLHLAGDRLAGDLAGALAESGLSLVQPVLYSMEEAETLPHQVRAAFREGWIEGVILMSPRTARICARLLAEAEPDVREAARRAVHFCLSRAVADALAPLAPEKRCIAAAPSMEELLALVNLEAAHLS